MNIRTQLLFILSIFLITPSTLLHGAKIKYPLDFLDCSDPLITPAKRQRMRTDYIREKNEHLIKTSGLSEDIQQQLLGYYCAQTILSNQDISTTLRFSPDGRYLAANSRKKIVIFDANNLKTPIALLQQHKQPVEALSFSPDGRYLVSGAPDKKIIFWDAHTFSTTPLKIVQENNPPISDLSFSPDSRFLAAGGTDGIIKFWKVARYREDESTINPTNILLQESTLRVHLKNTISSLCFSPCSRYLAVAVDADERVQIFATDIITSESYPIKYLKMETTPGFLSFSPDGRYLAISHRKRNSLEIWNAHTFTKQASFHNSSIHERNTNIHVFSPSSQTLVVGNLFDSFFSSPITIFATAPSAAHPVNMIPHARIKSDHNIDALLFSPDGTSFLCSGFSFTHRSCYLKVFQPYYLLSPDYIQFLIKYYKNPVSFDDLSDIDKILVMQMPEGARPHTLQQEIEGNPAQIFLASMLSFMINTSEYNAVRG